MKALRLGSVLGFLAASLVPLAAAQQFVHVVDPCHARVAIYEVGVAERFDSVDLRDGGSHALTSIAFSSLDAWSHRVSFVTQGRYLRALRQGDTFECSRVILTVDIEQGLGLTDLRLTELVAAAPLVVEDESGALVSQTPLYVFGNDANGPLFFVFDQEKLLAEASFAECLLGWGSLCPEGTSCLGSVSGAATGQPSASTDAEVAYVATVTRTPGQEMRQRMMRVARGSYASAPWSVTLEPWNEGNPWSSASPRHIGVAFDARGERAYGTFKPEREFTALDTASRACPLDEVPTDLALWGPPLFSTLPELRFVVGGDTSGGMLRAAPLASCGKGIPAFTDDQALPYAPTGIALSASDQSSFWVLVASSAPGLGELTALRYDASASKGLASLECVERVASPWAAGDCGVERTPTALAIGTPWSAAAGTEAPHACHDGNPSPSLPCCLDEDDPNPHCEDCEGPVDGPLIRDM